MLIAYFITNVLIGYKLIVRNLFFWRHNKIVGFVDTFALVMTLPIHLFFVNMMYRYGLFAKTYRRFVRAYRTLLLIYVFSS